MSYNFIIKGKWWREEKISFFLILQVYIGLISLALPSYQTGECPTLWGQTRTVVVLIHISRRVVTFFFHLMTGRQVEWSGISISFRIFQCLFWSTQWIKGFSIGSETEVDVFLEFSCFFYDPMDVGNLICGSSAFSKSSLYIWKFSVHLLLKSILKDFEHYFAIKWNEHHCAVVWTFFSISLLWDWNENWPFQVLWPLLFSKFAGILSTAL